MSEPVILINGRRLVDAQVRALRNAVEDHHRMGLPESEDRLAEILAMLNGSGRSSPPQLDAMAPGNEHRARLSSRADRILLLAGVVPEQATEEQRKVAVSYAESNAPIDECATLLRKALEKL